MSIQEYISVDLEMTGLNPQQDRILEIGAVRIVQGHPGECFQVVLNPHRELSETVISLTGITQQMAERGCEEQDALQGFLDFAGELPLLGHNLMADYRFLKQAAKNHGMDFERKGIDTWKIARKILKEPEKKSLDELCRFFDIPLQGHHRALDDARACGELFLCLKKKFQEKEPGLFVAKPLQYKVKKQSPITPAQKRDLNHLLSCHKIEPKIEIGSLTRNEASRMIDRIYAEYGRMPVRQENSDYV